jgi:hypothetical protein
VGHVLDPHANWNPERKDVFMNTVMNKPKKSQVPAPQQVYDISRPKSGSTVKPTNQDIAKRAYEIYVEKGCQQGQCEENWKQAERELKKGLKIISAQHLT